MKKFSDQFTNQYSLSKTLRFELKPIGETQKILEKNGVFQNDKNRKKKYEAIKPFFDRLHREFVKESLLDIYLSSVSGYLEIFKKWKKNVDKKDKKKIEKELKDKEKNLRKEVITFFNSQAEKWADEYNHFGIKKNDIGMLFEKDVFSILKDKYGNEKESFLRDEETKELILDEEENKISIFDGWDKFMGYFTKFFETRKNFYKDDGTSTAIATRIIDHNLRRFCDNILLFENIKNKLNFSETENHFDELCKNVFKLDFYDKCFLQEGIDKYNSFIGADSKDQNKRGLNQLINEYRQKNKGDKIPFFKTLDKQILGEKEKFVIDAIEKDDELFDNLKHFRSDSGERIKKIKKLFADFVKNNENYELSKIYISREAFNTISHKWTGETQKWEDQLAIAFKDNKIKLSKKKDSGYSFPDFISLDLLKKSLENSLEETFWKERYSEKIKSKEIWRQFLEIFELEFNFLFELEFINDKGKPEISGYKISKENLDNLIKNFKINDKTKIVIKDFADSVLSIYQMAKYFAVEKKGEWNPNDLDLGDFYLDPEIGYKNNFYDDAYEEIVQVYNKLRNYLTKKPYSEEKWKLNFENSTLADGWDKNKESDNFTIILRKDNKYYLGLMKKGCNHIFSDENKKYFENESKSKSYEKMVYKLLPGPNKMLPKVFFSKSNIEFFNPSKEIIEIRNYSSHTKGGTPQKGFDKKEFSIKDCHKLIEFFKESLKKHKDWKDFNFKFSKTSSYKDINYFYKEVEKGGYKISWQNVAEDYIQEKNENGELYLFQIKNKDWNDGSTGSKNLHTLYFENLFSNENVENSFIFKLNGQAEIFYRPKSIEAKKVKRNFKREIIEKRRYSENKILFHVPINLNRGKGEGKSFIFNKKVNEFLVNNPEINIIGVDRGEKHLAYYSVVNQKQEILESGSLNFAGKGTDGKAIDYHEKLETRAKNREQERKDWQTVEGIKDLKKGYISQVVRKLADLAIEHNAIIVFEDLNMRFKQIRGGIEKSVYQQLEKALIDKLSFLVNKGEKDSEKAGHLLKAYQLAAPFTTFKEMGKQTGIVFYTTASYTSKIDPITGWRPNLYLKNENAKKNKENILNFSEIEFVNNRFEFTYDLKEFIKSDKAKFSQKTEWTVCSSVERFRWNRNLNNNKGGYDHYKDLTDDFKNLFKDFKIDIQENILEQIKNLETKGNEKFFSQFIFLFGLVCQIRNTDEKIQEKINRYKKDGKYSEITEKEIFDADFILSPVEPFFDSRKDNGKHLPKNGDDNGAFNIARKGIMVLDKISEFVKENGSCEKLNWGDLYVSNQEWDDFVNKKK